MANFGELKQPETAMSLRLRPRAILDAWSGVLIAIAVTLLLTVLAFELRGSWDRKADPVVPIMVPFFAIGGAGVGLMWERGKDLSLLLVIAFGIGILFLVSRVPPMSEIEHGQYALGVPMTLMLMLFIVIAAVQAMTGESRSPRSRK